MKDNKQQDDLEKLAIEDKLPLKAVGIENLKEDNPQHMPPHRYLHPWFARRPTPVSRLAILASVLPAETSMDEILRLMQIVPEDGPNDNIKNYVEKKKATEDDRNGTLGDHYGYDRPFTSSPSPEQLENLHSKLKSTWDGQMPTVLDPTAGGGVIPFESLRYDLPTEANELNSVPSLILKVLLRYPVSIGSLEEDIREWGEFIDKTAKQELQEYYPGQNDRTHPSHYAMTYAVRCSDCEADVPTTPKWWLHRVSANEGVAVRPEYDENGELSLNCVHLPENIAKENFNPQDGPRSRGGNLECPNCGYTIESESVKQMMRDGDYSHQILGVKYIDSNGGSKYRAPTEKDKNALESAIQECEKNVDVFDLLSERIPEDGHKTSEPASYGLTQWQDIYNPRQLLCHYEYMSAFEEAKETIQSQYSEERTEAILTVLSLVSGKMVDYNSRLSPYKVSKGYPENAFAGKNFSLQWLYVDNNLYHGNRNYNDMISRILDSYEEIVSYLENSDPDPAFISSRDAADLAQDDNSVQCIVIDPPYYSSIMYSELADVFYVWHKRYLSDVHPELFNSSLTNKEDEAVANPARFDELSGESNSKKELAKRHYETKMSDIFSELYRILEPGGVMTVMFTHKEIDAWDTLTTSLIQSGFIITATHPITSEMPARMDVQNRGSADSTLLLTGRKVYGDRGLETKTPSLWEDVRYETRKTAKESARDLLESGLSLTKTDVIISAFGPTLRIFTTSYPVVDSEGNEVAPREALKQARSAVTQVLVDKYIEGEGINDVDNITKWYCLCWLIHENKSFDYDDGYQLGLGLGVDIDNIKRDTKTWRKSRGDIILRSHTERVQDITKGKENRSSRKPVDPNAISFNNALDKVHAAMHVYDVRGEQPTRNWLSSRDCGSDPAFKATLKTLLQVLPQEHEDWEVARDLIVGKTGELLEININPNLYEQDGDDDDNHRLDEFSNERKDDDNEDEGK